MNWRFWRREQPTPSSPEPEKHEHRFLPVYSKKFTGGEFPKETTIVHRCECGEVQWSRIAGHWEFDEAIGKPKDREPFSDAKFLKDCGIKR
jgi:hypothetical protein